MRDAHSLARQVRRNCAISDARFAGLYSVCGLVMRLRDLYKWEHSLAPHEEHEASQILILDRPQRNRMGGSAGI